MAQTVQNWQTWKPEIDAYVQDELDQLPESLYTKLFTVRNVDRLQMQEVDYGNFGPMVEVGELGDAVDDNAIEGYKFAYQRRSYRKSTKFSSDLMETDQTGTVEKIARQFANVVEYSRNLWIFGMFRNAWNSLYTYGDGKPLASTLHPIKSGIGTQANTFADGVQRPLTYDNALLLQDVMIANVSNAGNIMQVGAVGRNKILWCSPYLREQAFQIAGVGASTEKPTTADRAANYFIKGDKFDVLSIPWITYEIARQAGETGSISKTSSSNYWDKMWGIIDVDVFKNFFRLFVASGYAKYDEEITKANQALVKYAYDKYVWGCTAWYGLAMSKGDNSTYSS